MHEHFRRYFWTNIALIAGSFALFGLVFYIFAGAMDSRVTGILADRAAINQRSTDLETLSRLKTDTAAAAEFEQKIDALLPTRDLLIGFSQYLNTTVRNHSLSLTFTFDGSPVDPAGQAPGYVDFTAIVEGEGANINLFVNEIENKTTRFMINVHKLTLLPRTDSVYRADIKGRVFFQENKTTTP